MGSEEARRDKFVRASRNIELRIEVFIYNCPMDPNPKESARVYRRIETVWDRSDEGNRQSQICPLTQGTGWAAGNNVGYILPLWFVVKLK